MTTIYGTSDNDFVHVAGDGLTPPVGWVDVPDATDGDDEFFDLDGGVEHVSLGGGDDVFLFVGGLTAQERLDGGEGEDILIVQRPGTIVFEAATITNIEFMVLGELVPGTFTYTFHDANIAAGSSFSLSGLMLTAAAMNMDFTAESDATALFVEGGMMDDTIRGGAAPNFLAGAEGNDFLVGGAANDELYGDDGEDMLEGGAGDDYLEGGLGNDIYVNPVAGDTIVECGCDSGDEVQSNAHFSLYDNQYVENLTLTGATAIYGTGNFGNNVIAGNAIANQLWGSYGDDTLIGGGGADTLNGGFGNDIYVDPTGDTIIDASGIDTVQSHTHFSIYDIAAIENLTLTGSASVYGTGNAGANLITGNSGANALWGSHGNDTIVGGDGADTLTGGYGRDDLTGGAGADVLAFVSVADATGVGRDLVHGFDFSDLSGVVDRFKFTLVPTAIADPIVTGVLNEGSFNADLELAVNTTLLKAGEAVLFDPNDGDLNVENQMFLIVDANGADGYQGGGDYVVQIVSSSGTLSLANFI